MNKVRKFIFSFFLVQFFLCLTSLFAIEFEFKYTPGYFYRILSTVEEEVFINGIKNHDATIVNRVSVTEKEVFDDGSGRIEATFMTTENSSREGESPQYVWGEEYFSTFTRSRLGVYDINSDAFMPVVRNVPVFPDYDVQPGDIWVAEGEEVHDMRLSFGIEKPFKVPFTANYLYEGTEEINGETYHVILVNYTIFSESPTLANNDKDIPILTMGNSNQTLYWDVETGYLSHYNETFRIIMETSLGNRIEFRGRAHAEVTDFAPRTNDANLAMVQEQIDNLGIEDVTVHVAEKGITISLEDIQFEAESDILLESELIKLQKIAEILMAFPENDLLISGHTAFAGTYRGRQELSENRASAVADYFAELGVRRHEQLFTKGFGASAPIAPNDTPKNMSRNRRVEITILDR